jgi:putative ABC transport system permease protein
MRVRVTSSALTARMLRRRAGSGLVVALLSLLLAAAVAAVPIVLGVLGDRVAQEAVASLSPGERDVEASAAGVPPLGAAPPAEVDMPETVAAQWGLFDSDLEGVRQDQPEPLRGILAPARYVVRSSEFGVDAHPQDKLTLMTDPRFQDEAVLTTGSWPLPREASADGSADPFTQPMEVALSEPTAADMSWPVGETRYLIVGAMRVPVTLVGLFAAAAGSEDYWYHVPSVLLPKRVYSDLVLFPTGTAVLAPEALATMPFSDSRTTVWYPLVPDELTAAEVPQVTAQLRAMTAGAVPVGTGDIGTVQSLSFDTAAIPTLEHALDTQSAMAAVFVLTASGPAGAAIAVLAVACRVIARNRRPALALLAARGASAGRLRAMQAWHGVWFGTLPAVLGGAGILAATALAGRAVPAIGILAVVVVAALPPVILGAIAPPGPRLEDEVPGEPTRRQRRRRLAVELVVVVVALLAAAALVSAVVAGDRVGSSGSAASALALFVPLLAALVGCVVALRVYPIPLRALLARLRRGRRLTGFLGAARSVRESAVGIAPVLALIIGVSSAATSGVLLGSIQHEIDTSARAAVGADIQLGRADLTDERIAEIERVPGVAGVAPIGSVTRITLRGQGGAQVLATLLAVDPAEIAAVQDPEVPLVPPGSDLDAEGTLPVVLAALTSSQLDGATDISVNGEKGAVTGVSQLAGLQGITDVWAVIADSRLEQVTREAAQPRNAFVRVSPGADAAAVSDGIRSIVGADATILTTATMRDELTQRTGTAAIRWALIVATAAAALFGALAVVLSLVLSAPARDRLLGLLGAVGAPRRVGRGLVWWELWPPLTAAVVVGIAVGLAVPALLLATVDFGVFVDAEPAYHLDPVLLAVAVAGFLALTAVLTAVALMLSRRVRAASVLRQTQEG